MTKDEAELAYENTIRKLKNKNGWKKHIWKVGDNCGLYMVKGAITLFVHSHQEELHYTTLLRSSDNRGLPTSGAPFWRTKKSFADPHEAI